MPPNWEHPKRSPDNDPYKRGGYQPMYNSRFEERFAEWLADFDRIRAGDLTDFERECYPSGLAEWLQDEGVAPHPAYYVPYKSEDATWFQVYETVSEGTPVSPPFATKEELIDYLAAHGDFWDQKRGHGPWGREAAARFVEVEWAPSMMTNLTSDGLEVKTPRDGIV